MSKVSGFFFSKKNPFCFCCLQRTPYRSVSDTSPSSVCVVVAVSHLPVTS
jgi:hypothetical protein